MAKWGVSSRITSLLTVCDVFEAMTAVHHYKSAMQPRRAYEVMLKDQGAFDPGAFAALVTAMGVYPPGSAVRLSDGSQGVVPAAGESIDGPIVRPTRDQFGQAVSDDTLVHDLSNPPTGLHVTELLDPTRQTDLPEVDATPLGQLTCAHDHHDPSELGRLLGKRV